MFGRGINSIRVRFTILIGVFAALSMILVVVLDEWVHVADLPAVLQVALVTLVAIVPATFTYWMTGRLTRPIEELRKSTEALANGATDIAVDVACQCEVGGLADAFRKMVDRFNSNILRMNVLAYSDAVTRMPNRAALRHVLAYAMSREVGFKGAVIFIDLDNFKHVNDSLGHEAGDQLLRLATERMLCGGFGRTPETLHTCTTPLGIICDFVPDLLFARFAGDEFVAVLPDIVEENVLADISARIIASLNQPFVVNGVEVSIGASVGIARAPVDSSDPAEILSFADLAMYSAKRAGKNRFSFFDAALRAEAMARAAMEAELRAAIERDDLVLEFQPKIRTSDLSVCGVEALVRMRDSEGRIVPPGKFIDIAESCGLIDQIGSAVLRKSVAQASAWARKGLDLPVAVNVSPIQFSKSDFAEQVIETIAEQGLDTSLIEVEVTESAAMKDLELTRRRLERLRAAGVRISIDDFGTGFSNLSQFVQLPFDVLKIDRSLVSRIGKDPKSETVLDSIISMARGLGYTTVAEGVEAQRQFAFLEAKGCTTVQGFLFGHPMPPEQLEQWMRRRSVAPDLGQARLNRSAR